MEINPTLSRFAKAIKPAKDIEEAIVIIRSIGKVELGERKAFAKEFFLAMADIRTALNNFSIKYNNINLIKVTK